MTIVSKNILYNVKIKEYTYIVTVEQWTIEFQNILRQKFFLQFSDFVIKFDKKNTFKSL